MAKKKSKKVTPQSLLMGIIGAIVIAVAAYFGIDLTGEGTTTAPPADNPPAQPAPAEQSGSAGQTGPVTVLQGTGEFGLSEGFGAEAGFWQVFFTAPTRNDAEPAETCMGGIDEVVVAAITNAQSTLDIAAFEWKNECITEAVIAAADRGVTVRMVIDDEHVLEENEEAVLLDEPSPFQFIIDHGGVEWKDDDRSGLMHNKFMIIDSQIVLTGSMNFTPRGTYTNNNNLVRLRSQRAVQAYQTEFNEMFEAEVFGPRGDAPNDVQFNQDGVPVRIIFSPDDPVSEILVQEINNAQTSIRFMTFSFTLDSVGQALLGQSNAGIDVAGIFETRASETEFSELPRLLCAGLDVVQDGNSETFHHKVFIIDETTVMTGSFNISDNATTSNDENMIIIRDPALAAQFLAEYDRMRAQSNIPDGIDC
jgi:phosphatidylserine/phosphatidylglycerophosphate/cardiolipin synthase-like enzyme